jgi:hypothetical protein
MQSRRTRRDLLCSLGAALIVLICSTRPAAAAEASLVTIDTPRGAKQSFILLRPEKPVAIVVLFAGGHGALGLQSTMTMRWGAGNFLVRSRQRFADHGFMVAVMDAPSDQQDRMYATFRMGADHAADIGAVAAHLKGLAAVPVWLIGTSMGTFSAAGGAIAARGIDGLVLSSTITGAKPAWHIAASHADGVASMALDRIAVPTLIVSHKGDACDITPARDAAKLVAALVRAPIKEVRIMDGGLPPISEPCEAHSPHGFLGIEDETVAAMAAFIKAQLR